MRGHEILQKTRDLIEEKGFSVIYGDTDSVFVLIEGESSVGKAGDELASYLNEWWRRELSEVYQIESHLEIEFETHYLRFFMPTIRGSEKGSKKRYAGLVEKASGKAELVIKGLESVRSDWSPLARDFQQALFRRLFMNEPIEAYVIEMVQRVLDGSLDDKLTLRRRLRRKLEDYTKNVPPHVRAARHADERRVELGLAPAYQHGGWIEYVMTTAGPEPLAYLASTIDYEFYIDRQLAPIADAILGFQGTSLGALTDKQLGLF
jgi:DNA polymerase-2